MIYKVLFALMYVLGANQLYQHNYKMIPSIQPFIDLQNGNLECSEPHNSCQVGDHTYNPVYKQLRLQKPAQIVS